MNAHSPQRDDWLARAQAASILAVAQAAPVSAKLKRIGVSEWAGPCPRCQGVDRFSINTKDDVYNCRGAEGGKGAIGVVMHALACDFLTAVEIITGERRPDGVREESDEGRREREARDHRWRADAEARRVQADRAEAQKRQRDEEAVDAILARAVPIAGSHAEAYLRARGLRPARRLSGDLRFVADLDYWGFETPRHERKAILATLPAMVAVIRDVEGRIIGAHQTFLDPQEPRKWAPTGDTKRNGAKKIRGQAKGGLIRLGMIGETLAISEGIETGLSWHALGHGPEDVSIAAGISLGNIAGGATGSIPHPTLAGPDGKPVIIRNGVPDMEKPGVILPAFVREVILLGDGDSEPMATRGALLTGARRFRAEGRGVSVHESGVGGDWNDELHAHLAELRERAA